ncbi:MAG: restriction endonuclease subunit S [Anaerolineae bacterium]|nr:restriction endonuclease subunit S [Anaerolineae bacterium]
MTLELLLAEFDGLIQTPADVAKLNATILQWAVQGRLVLQCADDEPVQVLLKKIDADREKRIKARQIRRQNDLPEVEAGEQLFTIPKDWKWIRLGEIGDWGAGATPSRRKSEYYDGTIPWLKTGELNDGYIGGAEEHVTDLALKETSLRLCKPGDVLIAMYGATIGKLGILEIEATTNQACCACTPFEGMFNRFLFMYLFAMRTYFREQGAGGAQPNISRTKIIATPFPLPPLAEQKRIVARVDELLGQTAVLTQQLASVHEQRRGVHTAVLHQLTTKTSEVSSERSSPTSEVYTLATHFDRFYVDADTVAELKQAILQLAVQGRLVPQDERDEDAAVLLARLEAKKKTLVEANRIKTRKVKNLVEQDVPFLLPKGWAIVRFGKVTETMSGVTKGRKLQKFETTVQPYLRVANVQRGYLDLEEVKEIEIKKDEVEKYRLESGDLLLTEGGDADKVGRSAIWREQISDCIHQNHIFRARPLLPELKAEWLMLCTNSQYGREYFLGAAKQTTNLASINMTQLVNFPLVLPPINEQKRIMAKMDELFALCDQLAGQLTTTAASRTQLLEAVLAQA